MYVLVGDFNLPNLAENDFEPSTNAADSGFEDEDYDENNMSVDQMWADFYNRRHLDQWVHESTFWRYNSVQDVVHESITDFLMAPATQDIHHLDVTCVSNVIDTLRNM